MPIKKRHPFWQAPVGSVFAIAISPKKWGFVRFRLGLGMDVLPFFSKTPTLTGLIWDNLPDGWFFYSFAPDADKTKAVNLGNVPFADKVSSRPPPTYYPPGAVANYYRIYSMDGLRNASKAEVQDLDECVMVTPKRLAKFLREKLKQGELREI